MEQLAAERDQQLAAKDVEHEEALSNARDDAAVAAEARATEQVSIELNDLKNRAKVRAASLGLPLALAIIGGQTARFRPFVDLYRHSWVETGQAGEPRIAINTHALVADSRQQAEAAFSAPYLDVMKRIGGSAAGLRQDAQSSTHSGPLALGSPEEVAEKIVSFRETFEPERYLAHIGIGAVSHADVMRAIELFGTQVAPVVHSETRLAAEVP